MKYLLYVYGVFLLICLLINASEGSHSNYSYTPSASQTKSYPNYSSQTSSSTPYEFQTGASTFNNDAVSDSKRKEGRTHKNKRTHSSRKNRDSEFYWDLNNPDDLEKWMQESRAKAERQLNAMREQNEARFNSIWSQKSSNNYSSPSTYSTLNLYSSSDQGRASSSKDLKIPNSTLYLSSNYNHYTGYDNSNSTYEVNGTTYYHNRTYETTGKPMVKRNASARRQFLSELGYEKAPIGYEVDHIIPLSEGGSDTPDNMQLLTKEAHRRKTAQERRQHSAGESLYNLNSILNSNSTLQNATFPSSSFNSSGTFDNNTGSSRTIHTGPRGGQYYINDNGNKTYLKKN